MAQPWDKPLYGVRRIKFSRKPFSEKGRLIKRKRRKHYSPKPRVRKTKRSRK